MLEASAPAQPRAYIAATRLNQGPRLHKLMRRKLHLSRRAATAAVGDIGFVCNPLQWFVRRSLAAALTARTPAAARIADSAGYSLFRPGDLPGLDDVVGDSRRALEALRARSPDGQIRSEDPKKKFQVYVLSDAEFAAYPRLLQFALSRPVIERICTYTRSVPLLCDALLYLTLPNDSVAESQKYHLDFRSPRPVKLFVNILDTSTEQGPFTFLPADVSDEICRRTRYDGDRLEDDEVEAAGGRRRAQRLVGPPGTGCFIDTARCLHYGARQNRSERLVLMLKYINFYAPESRPRAWSEVAAALPGPLDRLQRLVLGLR